MAKTEYEIAAAAARAAKVKAQKEWEKKNKLAQEKFQKDFLKRMAKAKAKGESIGYGKDGKPPPAVVKPKPTTTAKAKANGKPTTTGVDRFYKPKTVKHPKAVGKKITYPEPVKESSRVKHMDTGGKGKGPPKSKKTRRVSPSGFTAKIGAISRTAPKAWKKSTKKKVVPTPKKPNNKKLKTSRPRVKSYGSSFGMYKGGKIPGVKKSKKRK